MEFVDRLSVLRKYEERCYSICYYLLQNEETAYEAAKMALLNVFASHPFFAADAETQQQLLREQSIHCSFHCMKHKHRTLN